MQFITLIHGDEGRWDAFTDEEREAVYEHYRRLAAAAEAAGVLAGGHELASTRDATNSFETRFIPSRSGVTSMTSAAQYRATSSSIETDR